MKYQIDGGNLPVVKVQLERGEEIVCEAGAMSWMDEGIEMQTSGGSLGKMFGRIMTNENAFLNTYYASNGGEIAFSAKFPGSIRAVEVTPEKGIIIQKGAFLAAFGEVENEVFFQKKMRSGFFGGEGFLMRRFFGRGIVFLEIDGSAHTYDIPAGGTKIVDSGYLAAMDETCNIDIRTIKGVGNVLFGGEGLFNTVVSGPGQVILQSMPVSQMAEYMSMYIPTSSGS